MKSGILSTVPMSDSIASAASLAPPWAGPHRQAMPAAIQANGLAPEEPAGGTAEGGGFCWWGAGRMRVLWSASAGAGWILYSSQGTGKHRGRKLSAKVSEVSEY